MRRLVLAVLLLMALCFSIAGCGTAVGLGASAIKSGVDLYQAGSGGTGKSDKAKVLQYDAATHRYYIVDEKGNRIYE